MGDENQGELNRPLLSDCRPADGLLGNTTDTRREVFLEVKRQLWLAGPLTSTSVLQFCLQLVSVMFVGHLGELSLSSASMATSFAGVTGFSLLVCTCFTASSIKICRFSYYSFSVPCLLCNEIHVKDLNEHFWELCFLSCQLVML